MGVFKCLKLRTRFTLLLIAMTVLFFTGCAGEAEHLRQCLQDKEEEVQALTEELERLKSMADSHGGGNIVQ